MQLLAVGNAGSAEKISSEGRFADDPLLRGGSCWQEAASWESWARGDDEQLRLRSLYGRQ